MRANARLAALTLMIGLAALSQQVAGVPGIPINFWGQAYVHGAPAADGTPITAEIDTMSYGSTVTVGSGWYSIIVPGDDPEVAGKQGYVVGDNIVLKLDGWFVARHLVESSDIGQSMRLDLRQSSIQWETYTGENPEEVTPGTLLYFEGDVSYANQGYTIRAASDITITASTYSFDTLSGDLEDDIYTAGDPYDYVVLTDIGQYTVQLLYGGDLLATDVINLVPVTPMNLESLGLGTLFLLALGRVARRRHDPPSA